MKLFVSFFALTFGLDSLRFENQESFKFFGVIKKNEFMLCTRFCKAWNTFVLVAGAMF
jgi:hypothetical protein